MSLSPERLLRRSYFLRSAVQACLGPFDGDEAAKVVPLSEAIQLRICACPPAPTTLVTKSTTEGADTENSIKEVVAENPPCSRNASCKCAECKAAMAAVMDFASGTPAAASSSPGDPQREMRTKFLQMSAAERSEALCGDDQTLAKAVGTWLQDMIGATSATRTQMQPQEALVAALDETAIWQHQAARRSANVAEQEEKVMLPFRSDTVLAALLRGGGFEAVVALCGGPADCTRWRALALLASLQVLRRKPNCPKNCRAVPRARRVCKLSSHTSLVRQGLHPIL